MCHVEVHDAVFKKNTFEYWCKEMGNGKNTDFYNLLYYIWNTVESINIIAVISTKVHMGYNIAISEMRIKFHIRNALLKIKIHTQWNKVKMNYYGTF